MTARLVVLLLVTGFPFKACGQVTENILYLAHYDYRYLIPQTYIGWLPANPDSYKNNMTLEYNMSYVSTAHYWNSLTVDYHAGNVSFHDKINHWIYLSDDFATPGGTANSIEGGTSGRVEAMTIDWLAQNVYWVDEGYNWIKMTNYFGEGEALIIDTGLERPSGIACHPSKGYLFWTELGNMYPPKIERSSMSGANRTTIVTGLSEPRSIAVDTTANRIYWIDNGVTDNKIESSDFNGDDRRTEVSQPSYGGVFDSISVDEDYIFVSVFGTLVEYFIRYYNKATPSELVFEYNFGSATHVLDLCVAGPNIQSKPTTLPCDGHTCGHFCVSAADGKHECVCTDNYVLYPNGTCSIDLNFLYPPFCVTGRTDAISIFDPSLLHYDLGYKQQYIHDFLSVDGNVTAVTVDIHSNLLFYAEERPTLKAIYVLRFEGGQYPVSIYSNIGRVDGMAVDWVSLNIYWVDYDQNRLMSSSYDGRSTNVVFYDVMKSRAIAVDPNARLIFWTEEASPTKLVSCNLDGTNRHNLMDTSLQNPSGIALDHAQRRVYIVGEDSTFIYFIDYDGTEQAILGTSILPATDVTIFQDFVLLAEKYLSEAVIESLHKISGVHEGYIYLNTSVYAIDTADESTQPILAPTTTATTTATTSAPTPTVPLSSTRQTTLSKTATTPTVSVSSTTRQTTVTTTAPTVSLSSTTRQTTAPVTAAAANDGNQSDSTLIIIGAAGAVVVIIIILFIIIIILMFGKKKRRSEQTGDTQAPFDDNTYASNLPQVVGGLNHIYASPAELKAEPPTYASSIDAYGGNQATGNSPYIATKLDHQFNTQDTIAFYSKSEPLQFLDSRSLGNPYVQHDSIPPPQYTLPVDTGYLELRPSVLGTPPIAIPGVVPPQ